MAAVALPAIGGGGISAKNSIDWFQALPSDLEEEPLAQLTTLLDSKGTKIAQFYYENRESVALSRVAPIMQKAIIAVEDSRFYAHGGIDAKGTIRALVKNVTSGGVTQGGSSITQQYVKQVHVENAETPKEKINARRTTVGRKLTEVRYALALEEKYTKNQILERYLNIAYFGAGSYGIQAAAKRFFGRNAIDLTLPQAATLAGAVQLPFDTDPSRGKKAQQNLLERRNTVLNRMAEVGDITVAEAEKAKATKLNLKMRAVPGSCEESQYPYFCLYVKNEILNNPAFGKDAKERRRKLLRGGLTIKTTLDPKMQAAAERAIRQYVSRKDKPVASQAMIVPGSGEIRAMAASREFGLDKKKNEISYNVVADAAHEGGTGFQAGSTFKMFTLATALKKGWRIRQGIRTPGGYRATSYGDFRNCKGERVGDPNHTVYNSAGEGGGGGSYNLQSGTLKSVNVFFMMLTQQVGLCDVVKTAKDFGIKRADGNALVENETFTLGTNEMDPITVANAYATLGARGTYCTPMAITEIKDRDNKITRFKPKCRDAIDPEIADAISYIMSGVFTNGTMAEVGGIGRDAAGKTGTTDGSMTAWFAGYTPTLASAVSIGDPRGSAKYPLRNITINGRYYSNVYGATITGRIWVAAMKAALAGTDPEVFESPNFERFGGGVTPGDERDRDEEPDEDDEPLEPQPLNDEETGDPPIVPGL
ncbi:transglycosylase domain-containing protein [Rhizohabitans arisaemae]|uniref:transglycosylase domain-containing protein n=1 Tax=Rhizohabitans arisaemae TaxID=2720610 RepID=UPI0024B214E3|nr:transglycosylase domain-containing protein [Rhizohabitans arisaemae]